MYIALITIIQGVWEKLNKSEIGLKLEELKLGLKLEELKLEQIS